MIRTDIRGHDVLFKALSQGIVVWLKANELASGADRVAICLKDVGVPQEYTCM